MNKNIKNMSLVLLLILMSIPFLGRTSLAQEPEKSFEEDIQTSPEGTALQVQVNDIESKLRDGGLLVRNYIGHSVGAIQDGHTAAFDQFDIWYRKRKNAERSATKGVAEGLLDFVFSMTVKKVFPEASLLEEFFQASTKQALDEIVSELKSPGGDVSLFLAEIRAAKNKYNAEIAKIPDEFPKKYPAVFLSAKWEYVFFIEESPDALPAEAKQYLSTVGVSEPTDAFRKELLENTFASYIERIMRSELRGTDGENYMLSYPAAAMAEALFVLDPLKNKQRICEYQRRGITAFAWRFKDCND